MRKCFFLLTLAVSLYSYAAIPEAQILSRVEHQVDAMFKDLSEISNKASTYASYKKATFVESYFIDGDQKAPNEFRLLGFNKEDYTLDIGVRGYVLTFSDMFRAEAYENYTFKYEKRSSRLIPAPQFKSGEAEPEIAQVVIRKSYLRGNMPIHVLEDTLIVRIKDLKIGQWANRCSSSHIMDFNGSLLDYEQMRTKAAIAYGYKQYRKAYELYEEISQKFPDEGESYYRMAVMLYKKEYGSYMSKKVRNNLILDYLDKARMKGASSISSFADNMKYWITC